MKKNLILASLLALSSFSFYACTNGKAEQNATTEEQTVSEDGMVAESAAVTVPSEDELDEEEASATGEVQQLSQEGFARKIADYKNDGMHYIGKKPCIVDFYATWCGPCKRLSPIMEGLARKYKGQLVFYKVDVDEADELSAAYDISAIPTVLFCANGEIRGQVGFVSEDELEQVISQMLAVPKQK